MQAQNIDIKLLQPNTGQIEGLPKNPRLIKDDRFKQLVQSIQDDPEMLDLRECIVYPQNGHFVIIAGNMRLQACKKLKFNEVPCKVLSSGTPINKLKAYTIKDNIPYGENDWEMLANDWDQEELVMWGMEIPDFKKEIENNYSKKIEGPIYTTSKEKPEVTSLINKEKSDQLTTEIENSKLPVQDKEFLKLAALRHNIFDFSKIADYYANSNKEVQELMEKSGLVIIDFNKAIEYGFVKISHEIAKLYGGEYDEA